MSKSNKPRKSKFNIFSTVLLVLAFLVLLATVVFIFAGTSEQFLFGYKPFIVSTGSMEPEYSTYGIVIIRDDNFDSIQIGDVVAFNPEELGGAGAMHRVIENTPQGYITKGDNNNFADGGYLTEKNYVGKEVWHTNVFAGYIERLVQPNGVLKFFVIPLAGIILLIVAIKLIVSLLKKQKPPKSGALIEDTSTKEDTPNEINLK